MKLATEYVPGLPFVQWLRETIARVRGQAIHTGQPEPTTLILTPDEHGQLLREMGPYMRDSIGEAAHTFEGLKILIDYSRDTQ